jgi:hypothetical protein
VKIAGCVRIRARSRADTPKWRSKVTDTSHDSTERLYQAMLATRDTKPWDSLTEVISVDQTWSDRSIVIPVST